MDEKKTGDTTPQAEASGVYDGNALIEDLRNQEKVIPEDVKEIKFEQDPVRPRAWFFKLISDLDKDVKITVSSKIASDLADAIEPFFTTKEKNGKYVTYTK